MRISRVFVSVLFVACSVPAFSGEKKAEFGTAVDKQLVNELLANPFKIYIESEEPGYAQAGYFEKQVAWKIISRPEVAQRLSSMCDKMCQVTIKKEAAAYVVMFAAGQGAGSKNWSWVAYENDGGVEIKNGQTLIFNNAIKDALVACYLDIREKRFGGSSGGARLQESLDRYYLYKGGAEAAVAAEKKEEKE